MTPKQWASYAEVAARARDWDGFARCIERLLKPDLQTYSRDQLLEHRNDLRNALIDCNDRLAATDGAGRASAPLAQILQGLPPPPSPSLDPSDPP
jgi:hypothetical protein